MEDIERQLAAATLRAVRRESEERHSRLQTLAPTPRRRPKHSARGRSSTNSGRRSVVVQRDVTALTPLCARSSRGASRECAYEPPRAARTTRSRWPARRAGRCSARTRSGPACSSSARTTWARSCARTEPSRRRWRRPRATCSRRRGTRRRRGGAASRTPSAEAWRASARRKACVDRALEPGPPSPRAGAPDTVAAGGALLAPPGRRGRRRRNLSVCGRGIIQPARARARRCDVTRPTPLALGRRVASVAAGAHHSLCVCDDGSLWAWGKAADHQLGTRVDDVMAPAPARVRLEGDLRARQVAAGAPHSLAVDADGGLWSWGRNAHGQLGHGTARPSPAPRRVLPLRARPVVQAAAGAFHSLAVLREGALYAFGLGADGRLGLGHQLNATLPEMVPLHQFVRQAAAGATHSACCDSAGCLYTWGDGAKGALGHLGPRPRKNKNDTGLASMPSWESALRLGEALQHSAGAAPAAELTPRPVAALRHVRVVQVQCNERETVALDGDASSTSSARPPRRPRARRRRCPRRRPRPRPGRPAARGRPSFGGGGPGPRRRRGEVRRRRAPLPRAGPRGRVVGAPRRRAHDRGHVLRLGRRRRRRGAGRRRRQGPRAADDAAAVELNSLVAVGHVPSPEPAY